MVTCGSAHCNVPDSSGNPHKALGRGGPTFLSTPKCIASSNFARTSMTCDGYAQLQIASGGNDSSLSYVEKGCEAELDSVFQSWVPRWDHACALGCKKQVHWSRAYPLGAAKQASGTRPLLGRESYV